MMMNSIFAIALSFLLATTSSLTLAQATDEFAPGELKLLPMLHEDDMEAVHAHAKEILSKCKLPDCVIVSLGTTNTLVDSFLRYYLKGEADRAIHYVPMRKLRSAMTLPSGIERSLPKSSPGLKRVMFVRTLAAGLSIELFADAVEAHFAKVGAPYAFEGYFSIVSQYDQLKDGLENRHSLRSKNFPWPYRLKQLPDVSAIDGSYRNIDDDYYRLVPIVFDSFDFWRANKTDPRVLDFKERVERSVGVNKSRGPKLFEMTEEVENAWERAKATLTSSFYTGDEAFLLLRQYLPIGSQSAGIYLAQLALVENELYAELQFEESPNYKVLDQAVKLFIEDPKLFTQNKCVALTISKK